MVGSFGKLGIVQTMPGPADGEFGSQLLVEAAVAAALDASGEDPSRSRRATSRRSTASSVRGGSSADGIRAPQDVRRRRRRRGAGGKRCGHRARARRPAGAACRSVQRPTAGTEDRRDAADGGGGRAARSRPARADRGRRCRHPQHRDERGLGRRRAGATRSGRRSAWPRLASGPHALRCVATSAGARGGSRAVRRRVAVRRTDDGRARQVRIGGPHGTACACRWVIDATGRRVGIARGQGARRDRGDRLVGLYAAVRTHDDDVDARTRVESTPAGWWYSALVAGGRRIVTFLTDADLIDARLRTRAAFRRALDETCHALLSGKPTLTSAPQPPRPMARGLRGDAGAIAAYERQLADVWSAYERNRARAYELERRWPDSVFWARRAPRSSGASSALGWTRAARATGEVGLASLQHPRARGRSARDRAPHEPTDRRPPVSRSEDCGDSDAKRLHEARDLQ